MALRPPPSLLQWDLEEAGAYVSCTYRGHRIWDRDMGPCLRRGDGKGTALPLS